MLVKLLTYWKDGELECSCPVKNIENYYIVKN